jgi:methyltransferase (TIGR00027 family)
MGAATLRALAALDEAVRGPDFLAEIFLTVEIRSALQDPALRKPALSRKTIPGMYEFMIARTAFFDSLVEGALSEGTPQIVFLGAGYDTRPYRFRELIMKSRIFELDAGPTQRRKLDILKSNGIPIPPELVYVPVNFNTGNFTESLRKAGFDKDLKTLFIWEGVTYYLPPAVIDVTLRLIKSCSPAGSSIGFDYASHSPEILAQESVRKLGETMRSKYAGEPVSFSLKAGALENYLTARGYAIDKHLAAKEMKREYLSFPGAPGEDIPAVLCLVHASHFS